jgi:hypothetical protein
MSSVYEGTYCCAIFHVDTSSEAKQLTLLSGTVFYGLTHVEKLTGYIEDERFTIAFIELQADEFRLCCIVIELTWRSNLQDEGQAKLIVTAANRLTVSGLWVQAVDDCVVNFG